MVNAFFFFVLSEKSLGQVFKYIVIHFILEVVIFLAFRFRSVIQLAVIFVFVR